MSLQYISRRKVLKFVGFAGAVGLAGCTGQNLTDNRNSGYPSDDIQMVIPYGTSGGYNAYARLVGKYLKKHLSNDVAVNPDNVQGSGGRRAMNTVYTSEPDGYTQMIVNINASTRMQLAFDTQFDVTEMQYFAQVANSPQAIGVSTKSGIKSWSDLVKKGKNGDLVFGGEGSGSTTSLLPKIVGEITGAYDWRKQNTIQFSGKSGIVASMKRGEVNVVGNPWDSLLPFVKNDSMRFVFFLGHKIPQPIANVQSGIITFEEASYSSQVEKKLSALSHTRIFGGPPSISDDRLNTIREAYNATINDDVLRQEAKEMNRPIAYRSGEDVPQVVERKFNTWKPRQKLLKNAMQ